MFSKKTLESCLKGLIYLSFFVPLIVAPSSFIFPFIVPKVVVLRSLIFAMFGMYALLLALNWSAYRPRFTPITSIVLLFIASFSVSTFVGVDPYHSFWDNHERMLGMFTLVHYAMYYVVLVAIGNDWTIWRRMLRVFLVAGSLVMTIGFVQVLKPTFLLNQGDSRVIGTLGNAIYMGGYGLFLTAVSLLLFLKEEVRAWKIAYVVMGLLGLGGMFFSGTRGSVLGLAAGMACALIAYTVTLKNQPRVQLGIGMAGLVFVVVIGILFAFRSTTFVQRIPAVGRAVNTSWSDFKSSPRYIAWQIAIKAWQEKPVFGWGPNNYYFAFNKYYDPRSLNFGYGETWFDNAHNIIVNTMAVQGTVGIITYLGIFGTAFFCLVRAYRRQLIDRHIFIVGGAFLVAHLVQNVTVFENITSYLYFFFWLGLLNRLSTPTHPVSVREDRKLGGGSYVFAGVVVVLGIIIFNIQPARANRATLQTLRNIQTSPELAIEDVKQTLAIDYSPHVDDIRTDVTRTISGILTSQNNPELQISMRLKDETRTAYFDIAYSTLQKNIVLHPLDIRLHFMLTELLQNQALATRNLTAMQEAESVMTHALSMSQDRQQLIFSLSIIKLYLGKNQEALDLLARARASNPKIGETYWRIAYIQRVMGDFAASKKTIAEGEVAGANFNFEDQRIVSQLLIPPPSTTSTTTTPVKKKK